MMRVRSRAIPNRSIPRRRRARWLAYACALICLAVASARPLAAQDGELGEALSAYASADAARLEAFVLQPRWEGFPTELLVERTAEGAVKGVEASVLLAALEDYAARLDQSHRILGKRATRTSLKATADVLGREVPEDIVRTVAAANPKDAQLTAAMVALGDLVAAGVPPREAEELLLDAATRRPDNEEVLRLPARVRRWIRQGYQPTDAAAEVRRTMGPPPRPGGGMLDRYTKPPPDRPF